MTRPFVPLFAAGMVAAAMTAAVAQQPPADAPEPKMPPMPSMEGQQGDVSKPVTQIPPRKKPAAAEKTTPAKAARPAPGRTKRPQAAAPRKKR